MKTSSLFAALLVFDRLQCRTAAQRDDPPRTERPRTDDRVVRRENTFRSVTTQMVGFLRELESNQDAKISRLEANQAELKAKYEASLAKISTLEAEQGKSECANNETPGSIVINDATRPNQLPKAERPPERPPSPRSILEAKQAKLEMEAKQAKLETAVLKMFGSTIIKNATQLAQLHDCLEEDVSVGDLHLLYSSSRDGHSAATFHAKCDNMGATLSIVETWDGRVIGGYTNTVWNSIDAWKSANKAFLFALSGAGLPGPIKLKLKDQDDGRAVRHNLQNGPFFGSGPDFRVESDMTQVYTYPGSSYEYSNSWPKQKGKYDIKEVEVFQVPGV